MTDNFAQAKVSDNPCGCLHPVADHDATGCLGWWRYPDVFNARPCGCKGIWTPDDSAPLHPIRAKHQN